MARKNKCPAESWVFVTKEDRALPKDQQSRFTLRPMTAAERDLTRDTLGAGEGVRHRARAIALGHIVSVDNFPVGEPKAWPSKREEQESYLALLDDDDVLQIGNDVWARSTLGAEEEPIKNSSSPERTSASGAPSPERTSTTVDGANSSG